MVEVELSVIDKLRLAQVERRVKPLREMAPKTQVLKGWIHYIRTSFGMSQQKLAELSGSGGKSCVNDAEKRELQGKIQIQTIQKYANAMDCEFIYAIVPRKNIEEILKERAYKKAKGLIEAGNIHMKLEEQEVVTNLDEQIHILADDLLKSGDVW
jgi:predicted DNA-binding mobile mystery protein A